jgi:hypothetical protein
MRNALTVAIRETGYHFGAAAVELVDGKRAFGFDEIHDRAAGAILEDEIGIGILCEKIVDVDDVRVGKRAENGKLLRKEAFICRDINPFENKAAAFPASALNQINVRRTARSYFRDDPVAPRCEVNEEFFSHPTEDKGKENNKRGETKVKKKAIKLR